MNRFHFILAIISLIMAIGCSVREDDIDVNGAMMLDVNEVVLDHGAQILHVTASGPGPWYLEESCDWITSSVTGGVGSGKVEFNVSKNANETERSAIVIFRSGGSTALLTIVQKGWDGMLQVSDRLSGTVIGTKYSVDYAGGNQKSMTVNTKDKVFDGNFYTFFASYEADHDWVGLDLGKKHIITKVGWSPRVNFPDQVELALIEGANRPDFTDALPLCIVKESGENTVMHYAEISCSRGFRYVRYVTPGNRRCTLSELEFQGYPGDGDDSRLCQLTNLPTVVIHTPGREEITSKEYELSSDVYIISENGTDLLATKGTGVRGRGNSTWNLPKKPYRLKFASKQSPLGAPASAKKWTLLSNYGDKSLLRNMTAFEVSRRVGLSYTPYSHPVDLVINSEYRGNYLLCDQVEAGSGRVEAKDGYLIEIDAYAYSEDVWFQTSNGTPVTIKHPDEDDITQQQREFIADYFSCMENAVLSDNYTDPVSGYRKYLDLDSFLRNFIVGEFCGNVDAFWSVYMYKDALDGKLYTGPTWDHDLSLENDLRLYPTNRLPDFVYACRGSVASSAVREMVTRIVKEDALAKARLLEIWDGVKGKGGLSDLSDVIDEKAAMLQESQQLNFKRWKILDKVVHQNFQALGSYDAEVGTVRNYVTERVQTLDALLRR